MVLPAGLLSVPSPGLCLPPSLAVVQIFPEKVWLDSGGLSPNLESGQKVCKHWSAGRS